MTWNDRDTFASKKGQKTIAKHCGFKRDEPDTDSGIPEEDSEEDIFTELWGEDDLDAVNEYFYPDSLDVAYE